MIAQKEHNVENSDIFNDDISSFPSHLKFLMIYFDKNQVKAEAHHSFIQAMSGLQTLSKHLIIY